MRSNKSIHDGHDGLAYFWFLNILALIALPLVIIAFIWALFFSSGSMQLTFTFLFDFLYLLVKFIASLRIIKLIKEQNKNNPRRIVDILAMEFIVIAILSIISFVFTDNNYEAILISTFYFVLWVAYFKLSKQVNSFYGNNFKLEN